MEPSTEKYPRTFHFPFSEGAVNDDRIQSDWHSILYNEVVITEKLDGENSCIKTSGVYARSHGAITQNPWAKPVWDAWRRIGHSLGDLHIFGENLYAIHSIAYTALDHYFYVFGMREHGIWLSWEETVANAAILDLPVVPLVFSGKVAEPGLMEIIHTKQLAGSALGGESEGIVCRAAATFSEEDFSSHVLKFVRKNHVQTDEHWTRNWKRAKLRHEESNFA